MKGPEKNRNIRDNIFVVKAVLNMVTKQNLKDTDIEIYDAEIFFKNLWTKECINDLFDNGFTNDKLPLLWK